MDLWYGGGEIRAFGKLLESMGVPTITVSYMGLRRRIKHMEKVDLNERFGENTRILLDSGGHSLNSAPDQQYSDEELKQIASEYRDFVQRHYERIEAYAEFDALQLGADWIRTGRSRDEKEIVVWHEEDGVDALHQLAEEYALIGVTGSSLGDRDLTPVLQQLIRGGTRVYGLGMTRPEQMASLGWTGVTSTSWLSPVKFRDLIVWTGNDLKRYPKKNREQGKKRHRTYFRSIGINDELIDADDPDELLKLSIWSWRQQAAYINKEPLEDRIAANPGESPLSDSAENTPGEPANTTLSTRRRSNPENAPTPRSRRPVPGWHTEEEDPPSDGDSSRNRRHLSLVTTNSENVLQCSSCHLAGKCPEFEPGYDCAFDFQAEIRTIDQLDAAMWSLAEHQLRRVQFGDLVEQTEGGYADPNHSAEIDRAHRLFKYIKEAEREGFHISIKASQHASHQAAGSGVLSRLFGREASEPVRELPEPVEAKTVAEQMGILDAEIVEGRGDEAA